MTSKYLGEIGGKSGKIEIHAFTDNQSYREIPTSEISDSGLFNQMRKERYNILSGDGVNDPHPIYCTAVNPDNKTKMETSPHDSREGTVHIVSVDQKGDVVGGLSIATDIGDFHNGRRIGLPLEDTYRPDGFVENIKYDIGDSSLNDFRKKYVRLNHGEDRDIQPGEMAELYRHFMRNSDKGNIPVRFAKYAGAFHLNVREARKNNENPTTIWVFDALPAFFNLYKHAGAAGLRDFTIKDEPEWISPDKDDLVNKTNGGVIHTYNGMNISRDVLTPIPKYSRDKLEYEMKNIPFLDGVVDIVKNEIAIRDDPNLLRSLHHQGFNRKDKMIIRMSLGSMMERAYNDNHSDEILTNLLNKTSLKLIGSKGWDFNGVGKVGGLDYVNELEEDLISQDV